MDLDAIQAELRARNFDGWLFYDVHHRDPIAYRLLGLPRELMVTRRWYYLIPAEGEARKLVHRIEARHLDGLPGGKREYSTWEENRAELRALLAGCRRVAMQYSPDNMLPAISLADAGTVELLRGFGAQVASSADLVARFESVWDAGQLESHRVAGAVVHEAIQAGFREIRRRLQSGQRPTESDIQQFLAEHMQRGGLAVPEPPIVAANAHAGDPHYEPRAGQSAPIGEGDLVLFDVWAKLPRPRATFYDVTWMGLAADRPPEAVRRAFALVRDARDQTIAFVKSAIAAGQRIHGWEVDQVARGVIASAGLGDKFMHRTGHSIGESVHANGANMDNYETRDERQILPHTCFSIEPGIYTESFGVRLEVNVYVGEREAEVTGPVQGEFVRI
ncbi:MAG: M24 family metallopeptidase [Terriglobales bacterium]